MNLNELTASKIRGLRRNLGYTTEAMAKDLGISKTAYSQMENGRVEITLSRIEMIANICNIPISDIIPVADSNHQISNGSGDNYNATTNTVNNNFFADTEDKLQSIVDNLTATIAKIKHSKSKEA